MPLKRVEPYLIRVDNATGVVDVVPIYTGHARLGEAVTRYFLTRYITVCEQFDLALAESNYEECGAFNSARLNQAMYVKWNRANPSSPLNVHKDGSAVTVRIESVSFFRRASGAADLAQVRYARLEQQGAGAPGRVTHWIASIEYRYGKPPDDPRTRNWNPLGFEVTGSRHRARGVRDVSGFIRAIRRLEELIMKAQSSFLCLRSGASAVLGRPSCGRSRCRLLCGRTRGFAWSPTGQMPSIGSEAMSAIRSTLPSLPESVSWDSVWAIRRSYFRG